MYLADDDEWVLLCGLLSEARPVRRLQGSQGSQGKGWTQPLQQCCCCLRPATAAALLMTVLALLQQGCAVLGACVLATAPQAGGRDRVPAAATAPAGCAEPRQWGSEQQSAP